MSAPESEARKALNRLRRSLEKGRRELTSLAEARKRMEGGGFPTAEFREAEEQMDRILDFLSEEERRLQAGLLGRGGIDAKRLRSSGGAGQEEL
jgi:hypothetical protein